MKALDEFKIQFSGLANGKHQYSFDIEKKFFEAIDSPLIQTGEVHVDAVLQKQSTMLIFDFAAKGHINVECDRCLANGKINISGETERFIVVKFDNENTDLDNEELVVLPFEESEINIANYVFEFINTLVPLSVIPCEEDNNFEQCNQEVLSKLNQVQKKNESETSADPRWEALQAFKKNMDN